jgi:hypothetical protein
LPCQGLDRHRGTPHVLPPMHTYRWAMGRPSSARHGGPSVPPGRATLSFVPGRRPKHGTTGLFPCQAGLESTAKMTGRASPRPIATERDGRGVGRPGRRRRPPRLTPASATGVLAAWSWRRRPDLRGRTSGWRSGGGSHGGGSRIREAESSSRPDALGAWRRPPPLGAEVEAGRRASNFRPRWRTRPRGASQA